jgi:hypothetical protein
MGKIQMTLNNAKLMVFDAGQTANTPKLPSN